TENLVAAVDESGNPLVDETGNPIQVPVEVPFETPTVTASTNPATTSFDSRTTEAGFAVGAGVEVRLAGNWTGKVEYLYLDFGRVATAATNPLNATPLAATFHPPPPNHSARGGPNQKPAPAGAATAPTADASAPLLRKAPMLAAWTWSGLYVGGTIGYSAGL